MRDLIAEGARGQRMAEFWDLFSDGGLRLQRCGECTLVRYPPALNCPRCGSSDADWVDLDRRGRLRAWTVTHAAAAERLPSRLHAEVPYVLGLVQVTGLADYLVPARVRVDDPAALRVGDTVELAVEPGPPRRVVAVWVAS